MQKSKLIDSGKNRPLSFLNLNVLPEKDKRRNVTTEIAQQRVLIVGDAINASFFNTMKGLGFKTFVHVPTNEINPRTVNRVVAECDIVIEVMDKSFVFEYQCLIDEAKKQKKPLFQNPLYIS